MSVYILHIHGKITTMQQRNIEKNHIVEKMNSIKELARVQGYVTEQAE